MCSQLWAIGDITITGTILTEYREDIGPENCLRLRTLQYMVEPWNSRFSSEKRSFSLEIAKTALGARWLYLLVTLYAPWRDIKG